MIEDTFLLKNIEIKVQEYFHTHAMSENTSSVTKNYLFNLRARVLCLCGKHSIVKNNSDQREINNIGDHRCNSALKVSKQLLP